jgi:hypothetical protein
MGSSDSKPKGMKNIYESSIGLGEECLSLPGKFQKVMWVTVAVVGVVILGVVGTMCFGVSTGKIDVNQLAKDVAQNMPAVVPV